MNKKLRLPALLAVVIAALGLSGCGVDQRVVLSGVSQSELSAGAEPYFNVGGITYQVQESRQLNPYSDDVQYFGGVKNAQNIPASDFWFGVFLWAKNQNAQERQTSNDFAVTDSAGNVYRPTALNTSVNPFAWTQQSLSQNEIEPNPDSIAASGTTGGGLILFKLPQAAYQNRPLTLDIYAPGSSQPATVSLDL